jgi:hypothetical protein
MRAAEGKLWYMLGLATVVLYGCIFKFHQHNIKVSGELTVDLFLYESVKSCAISLSFSLAIIYVFDSYSFQWLCTVQILPESEPVLVKPFTSTIDSPNLHSGTCI